MRVLYAGRSYLNNLEDTSYIETTRDYLIRPFTLLHILLARRLILSREETIRVFAEPLREFGHLVTELADGLMVHVSLGDEFGKGDCLLV